MLTTSNKILIGIILAILIVVGFDKCSQKNDESFANVMAAKDTAYIKVIKGITTSYNKAIVIRSEKQAKLFLAKNDTLMKLISQLKKLTNTLVIKETISITHDTIPLTDTIPCNFQPIPIKRFLSNYSFFGRITNKDLFIDSLFIPNKQSLVLGVKKNPFWKKDEYIASVVNSNPLIKTESIQNVVIKPTKKIYERPSVWASVFAIIGFILGTQTK